MSKCSLITFNFNGYDVNRTHFISDKINYNFITDKNYMGNKDDDSWYKSLYIRYHPFEYVNTPYVIVIDGSMEITSGIEELSDKFMTENYDIGLLLSHESECIKRISHWKYNNRITKDEAEYLIESIKPFDVKNYKGVVAGAVRLYHDTELTKQYLEICWNEINKISPPIRLDEIPSTMALEKVKNLKIMPLSTQLIQGDAFLYHYHNNNNIFKINYNKTKFYLKNKEVTPIYIGKSYHRTYEYKTEAICLTKYLSEIGLKEWIDHHLNVGFNHIHIFDNESPYSCEQICKEYGDKVSYEYVEGYARHYKLYDDYINSDKCKAEWVLAIDDDEYFELNKDICNNISECIDWYKNKFPNDEMFAIRWKHLFPKKFHTEPTGNILEYCTEENSKLAELFQPMGDRGVKTIVHRKGNIHYEEAEENPSGGHVPSHSLANGARLYNGELVNRCSCRKIPEEESEPARIIHCRFKGYTWYKNKYMNPESKNYCYGNCSAKPYIKRYKFNDILETLD